MFFLRHPLLIASILVLLIGVGANAVVRPELLGADLLKEVMAKESMLKASSTPATLQYGTTAEIFRFSLIASEPYTVRYVPLYVEAKGVIFPQKPAAWKVYLVQKGVTQFNEPVGYAEEWEEPFLRLRFTDPATGAYLAESGKTTFALVTEVFRASTKSTATNSDAVEEPSLSIDFAVDPPIDKGWAFIWGKLQTPWMNVTTSLGSERVNILPQ